MAQIPSDPDRRSSKAYELNQPNSAEKLYRAGNYHLRKVKSLSPFKLALVTVLTLTTIYCLLLVVCVAVDSIAMQPSTRSFTGDFRRASQRAADLTNGMLQGGNAPMVGQRSTADQRSRKAWGRGSRSKNEPIRPVRPAIVDDGDDDYFDDRLPPESEVSDDERERWIRESISRAAQRVRKEDFLLQASDSKAASSQGDAADDNESTPKKRKKGPARKFGSKSDLSRGSPREGRRPVNQASQLEKQHAATAVDPEGGAEIGETVPVTMEDEATVEEAPARSRVPADTARQAATSDASDDELDEDSEDEGEEEKPVPPPPRPASKKTKAQRLAPEPAPPRAPAPARKAAVLTNDKKLHKTRRPISKGAAAGAQLGPAPLDSSSAMEEEPDKPAAQRLAKAEAQLMAAREQLAAQVAADARTGGARQRPLDATVVPMQTMKTTRKEKVGGAARASADKSRVVDEPVQPKKDAGKQEQRRPMAMRAKKKGSPARQRYGPNA
ncbi:BZ3500_MvSof-1268-A1-R1_Chr1-3g02372 [Microbotryum saponariae]|uniref:BZ3500_MvSof-1268-A1-R1_Chr1-3g02372 protein n=1 Tax=Microbotryum saponariae TaxID=289078 RepID=A0A2X0KDA8_9BASI|nr:BZ3500_MvSof-1268-A1-R1_Chr1-3g02372 [Microbotryum saponariae]SCZ96139.1 BZ3501_MvSof-1269-A2-R1_Chr1-3g01975 [Microbotryum saponariae]